MCKSTLFKLTCSLLCFTFLFCGCNDYGQKIVVDGTEVYFDGEQVKKSDAEKLGQFLKSEGFVDGDEKSVQLQREGDKLIFKMVVLPEFLESGAMNRDFQLMCLQLSSAFDGQEVECHGCDDQLNFKQKYTGLSGERVGFGKADFYFNGVTEAQLDKVKVVLEKLGFLEFEGILHFGKSDGPFEFRMACNDDFINDDEIRRETKIWQDEFSKAVDGQDVAVLLCDEYLEAKFTREASAVVASQEAN